VAFVLGIFLNEFGSVNRSRVERLVDNDAGGFGRELGSTR
jgi:hypothetical protein